MKHFFGIVFFVYVLYILPSSSFYIPGVAPKEYLQGDEVEIKVNLFTYFLLWLLNAFLVVIRFGSSFHKQ